MTEIIPPPSGIGTVLLDIGADTGALILHAPAELNGVEIEISPNGTAAGPRTHSRVRERRVGATVRHAAVYPAVRAVGHAGIRLKEAAKLGFTRAVAPPATREAEDEGRLKVSHVGSVASLIAEIAAAGVGAKVTK